jgi:hypothetical protein
MGLRPSYNASHDTSHGLFAKSDSLNLDVLAGVQFLVHYNRSASAADVYRPSFPPQIFAMFRNAGNTDVQGQKDTIAFTLVLVHCRKSDMPCADRIHIGFVDGKVCHTASPRREGLKKLPVRRPAEKRVLFPSCRTNQHGLDSYISLSGVQGYDNRVKSGIWREQFTLPNEEERKLAASEKIELDVRFLFA